MFLGGSRIICMLDLLYEHLFPRASRAELYHLEILAPTASRGKVSRVQKNYCVDHDRPNVGNV